MKKILSFIMVFVFAFSVFGIIGVQKNKLIDNAFCYTPITQQEKISIGEIWDESGKYTMRVDVFVSDPETAYIKLYLGARSEMRPLEPQATGFDNAYRAFKDVLDGKEPLLKIGQEYVDGWDHDEHNLSTRHISTEEIYIMFWKEWKWNVLGFNWTEEACANLVNYGYTEEEAKNAKAELQAIHDADVKLQEQEYNEEQNNNSTELTWWQKMLQFFANIIKFFQNIF